MSNANSGLLIAAVGLAAGCMALAHQNHGLRNSMAERSAQLQGQLLAQRRQLDDARRSIDEYARQRDAPALQHRVRTERRSTGTLADTPTVGAPSSLATIRSDNLEVAVRHKYAALFTRLSNSEQYRAWQLLRERELLASTPSGNVYVDAAAMQHTLDVQRQAVSEIDGQLADLLGNDANDLFDLLKDSDFEQQQLREVSAALTQGNQINAAQQEALLLAKLTHKRAYAETIRSYQDLARSTDQAQRDALFEMAKAGLDRYRAGYLREAAGYLDDQQLAELSRYETAKFDEIESSLRLELQLN